MMISEQIEEIYKSLAIQDPIDIDIELIAYSQGAIVTKSQLRGCEARIVGAEDRAVIAVNAQSSSERQRFSIGHELGHWIKDRGAIGSLCQKESILSNRTSNTKAVRGTERVANQYAAEFLMPTFMVKPYARQEFCLDTLRTFKELFGVSWTAASIRLVDLSDYQAVIMCYRDRQRAWFHRSTLVPDFVYPARSIATDSPSANAVSTGFAYATKSVDGDTWLDFRGAENIEIEELVWTTQHNEVMVLTWWDYDIEGRQIQY